MGKFLKTGLIVVGIIATATCLFLTSGEKGSSIKYSEFIEKVENGEIEKVEVGEEVITAHAYEGKKTYTTYKMDDDSLIGTLRDSNVQFGKTESSMNNSIVLILLRFVMGIAPFVFILFLIKGVGKDGKGGGVNFLPTQMGMSKNKSKLYENKSNVTFKDVAGQDEAKESLCEIIDYLHNNKKYIKIGAKIPKGVLLVGPPGTGKTLIAKAVAGEANVPFYSLSGSDFVEMFVGVGASRVRDLFETAKKNAPCIIFIDEIDAIGSARSTATTNGHSEYEQTLNQLLSEMDGFETDKTVVVIGATNRPEVLDKALLRTGRFDRRIIIDKPDLKGRMAVLEVHAKDISMDETVDFNKISLATSGAVGSDLANIVNEAALNAVRQGRKSVSHNDLMEAVELVFTGKEKKDRLLNDKEKKVIAYHEIGHAVIAAIQKNTAPIQKITIIPRTMGSLGYTMQIPEEEKYLMSREDIISETRTLLAGRVSEEVFCNTVTTGASNDIERATKQIRAAITMYGMSDMFDMVALESVQNVYLNSQTVLAVSQETGSLVDREVCRIIKSLHAQVADVLKGNKKMVDEIAEFLIKNENMSGDEFMDIFRKYIKEGDRLPVLDDTVFLSQTEKSGALSEKAVSLTDKKEPIITLVKKDKKTEPVNENESAVVGDKPLCQVDGKPDQIDKENTETEKGPVEKVAVSRKPESKKEELLKESEKKKVSLKLDVGVEKEEKNDKPAENGEDVKKNETKREPVSPFEVATRASAKKQKEPKGEKDNKKSNEKKDDIDKNENSGKAGKNKKQQEKGKPDQGRGNAEREDSGEFKKDQTVSKKSSQNLGSGNTQGKGKAQKTVKKDNGGMEALMNELYGDSYGKKSKKKEESAPPSDDDISEDMY